MNHSTHTALVTGANSGLGFEAAIQLAESGYGRIILGCRSAEKATDARKRLSEHTGRDIFDVFSIDVEDLTSAAHAAQGLIDRPDFAKCGRCRAGAEKDQGGDRDDLGEKPDWKSRFYDEAARKRQAFVAGTYHHLELRRSSW